MQIFVILAAVLAVLIGFEMLKSRGISNVLTNHLCKRHVSSSHFELIKRQSVSVLRQGREALSMLKVSDYTIRSPAFYNASVGGHMRHILDHYQRVVYSHQNPSLVLNYDERKRDTLVETSVQASLDSIDDMIKTIPSLDMTRSVEVSFMGDDKTFEAYTTPSSVERELSFVAHHGVHHLATIKLIMSSLGYTFDASSTIGVAVSTVKDKSERGNGST